MAALKGFERGLLFRCLCVLFEAGIPFARALEVCQRQTSNPAVAAAVRGMKGHLQEGQSVSGAAARFPEVFHPHHVRLLAVGERTGGLGAALRKLADQEEKQHQLGCRLKKSLLGPALALAVSLLIVGVGPPFLWASLIPVLEQSGTALPLVTRTLLCWSWLLRQPAFYAWAALLALAVFPLAREACRRPEMDRWLRRLPGLGRLLEAYSLAQFSWMLSLTLGCGINLLEALSLAAPTSGSPALVASVGRMQAGLLDGETVASSLARAELLPRVYLCLVEVGEQVGELPRLLETAAAMAEAEFEAAVELLAALLEPTVIVVVGGIVGLTVVGLLVPLMQVVQQL